MKRHVFQALMALFLGAAVWFLPEVNLLAAVPDTGETNTGSIVSQPGAGQTNTGNTTGTVPGTDQTNTGTTTTIPGTDQTNTGGSSGTVPGTNQTNTGADTSVPLSVPNPQPSGGGGSVISYSTTPCSDVTYGEWGAPVNGYQFRDVISQGPAGCGLTIAQQEARSRQYPVVPPQILGVKYYPDGSLLRGPDWKIYMIVDGKKQFVKNWGELYKKYRGKAIENVSFEVLAQYAEVLGVKVYADGSLLRGPDKKIYLIIDGGKKPIKNLKELASYKGKPINNVSSEVLAQYPEVLGIKVYAAAGNLFRGPDQKIYLITNGKKQHIKSLQELVDYRGREITYMSNEALASYPQV